MGMGIILTKIKNENHKHYYFAESFQGGTNFFIIIDSETRMLQYCLDKECKIIIGETLLIPTNKLPKMAELEVSDAMMVIALVYKALEKNEFPKYLSREC